MPVIRIEVPEGTPQETKKRIREGVKQAVLITLAPKEIKIRLRRCARSIWHIGGWSTVGHC
jgi:phenylpyruvate tautomerase PptA (4-oxalocrotonate tautomerase family)